MTVYFANAGCIDLDVIRIMGVSVKPTSENPIGYFGTGLKFAISTLLRTGHKVRLTVGGKVIDFRTEKTMIRGEEFQVIFMGDERLPFTTQLGRNWEVWQAYRELHSNTLDEKGTITDQETESDTVISVTGEAFQREFNDRHTIFLQHEPLHVVNGLEVHLGRTRHVYYRGVRAGVLPTETAYTYNLTRKMELSEDRTIKSLFDAEWALATLIPTIKDRAFHVSLLEGHQDFDQNLNFSWCASPDAAFLDAAEQFQNVAGTNESARQVVRKKRQELDGYEACATSDAENQMLIDAAAFLKRLDCELDLDTVTVTETLGPEVYALYHKGQDRIYITRQALDNGTRFVAATLYEEYLHRVHKLRDESRALQQFLFDRLMAVAQRLDG